jgi:dienelactone hydrolase
MKVIALSVMGALVAGSAAAAVRTAEVEYRHGNVVLQGFLAYDDALEGRRPGVLIVHQWMGVTDYERMRAEQLAALGYVAFTVDVYGKGVRPTDTAEAGKLAGRYKGDRQLLRERVAAGLAALRSDERVDPDRIAAIGYCFGGTAVLELARSGADVAGVVSFHGGLDSPKPEDGRRIKTKVLVLHGADDPFVPDADLAAFQKELRDAKVDWQMVYYSGAVHAFTQPQAGDDPSRGAAYHERADRRSWQAMRTFFEEIFAPKPS